MSKKIMVVLVRASNVVMNRWLSATSTGWCPSSSSTSTRSFSTKNCSGNISWCGARTARLVRFSRHNRTAARFLSVGVHRSSPIFSQERPTYPRSWSRSSSWSLDTRNVSSEPTLFPPSCRASRRFFAVHLRAGGSSSGSRVKGYAGVYYVGISTLVLGLCFLTIPLYRIYCQATGQGQASAGHKDYSFLEIEAQKKPGAKDRIVKIEFQASTHESLGWEFTPQQKKLYVTPGETALAFYRAKNKMDRPVIGSSVYSVMPADAGRIDQLGLPLQRHMSADAGRIDEIVPAHDSRDVPQFIFSHVRG